MSHKLDARAVRPLAGRVGVAQEGGLALSLERLQRGNEHAAVEAVERRAGACLALAQLVQRAHAALQAALDGLEAGWSVGQSETAAPPMAHPLIDDGAPLRGRAP